MSTSTIANGHTRTDTGSASHVWHRIRAVILPNMQDAPTEEEIRKHADVICALVLCGCMLFALAVGYSYGTMEQALMWGLPLCILSALCTKLGPGSSLNMHIQGALLACMAALHVHLARGMIEFHFSFFMLLPVMLSYKRISPLWSMGAVIAVLHLVMDSLQQAGYNCFIFNGPFFGLPAVALHAFYVVVFVSILSYLALSLRQHAKQAEETALLLGNLGKDKEVDFTYRAKPGNRGQMSRLGRVFNEYADNISMIVSAFKMLSLDIRELNEIAQELGQGSHLQIEGGNRASKDLRQFVQQLSNQADQAHSTAGQSKQMKDDCFDLVNELNQSMEHLSRMAKQTFEANRDIQALASSQVLTLNNEANNKLMVISASLDHMAERMQTFLAKLDVIKGGLSAVENQSVQVDRAVHMWIEEGHANQRKGWEVLGNMEQMQASAEEAFKTLNSTVDTIVRADGVVSEMDKRLSRFIV